jgi:hypothetical protein
MSSIVAGFRSNLRIVIELFSIATALSFVLSAMMLFTIFKVWNLDFFALASVTDVVMGGLFILALLLSSLFAGAAAMAMVVLLREKNAVAIAYVAMFVLIIIGAAITLILEKGWGIAWFSLYRRWSQTVLVAVSLGLGVWIALYRSSQVYPSLRSLFDEGSRAAQRLVVYLLSVVALVMFTLANTGFGGIYALRVPAQQAALGCESGQSHLMWVGERSMVIRCGRHFRVLLADYGLNLEKVKDRNIPPGTETYFYGY